MSKEIHTTDAELYAVIGAAADAVICEKYGDVADDKADEAMEIAAKISYKTICHLTGEKKLDRNIINKLMVMDAVDKLLMSLVFGKH